MAGGGRWVAGGSGQSLEAAKTQTTGQMSKDKRRIKTKMRMIFDIVP